MAEDSERREQARPVLRFQSEHPNFPETSGTALPLLTTVLTGFAVTIIVQLMLNPGTTEGQPVGVVVALVAFLLATLFFISSTVLAINAQASNYLPFLDLSDVGASLLNVEDVAEWIGRLERRWYIYHSAAIYSFYGGIVLLMAGLNLIVWVFVGPLIAGIFLLALVVALGLNVAVGLLADRRGREVPR